MINVKHVVKQFTYVTLKKQKYQRIFSNKSFKLWIIIEYIIISIDINISHRNCIKLYYKIQHSSSFSSL
jgi:hypothetical protein